MRLLLLVASISLLLAAPLDREINQKSGELKASIQKERTITQKLETLGGEINRQQQKIGSLDEEIKEAVKKIAQNEGELSAHKRTFETLERNRIKIERQKDELLAQILEVIAQDAAFVMILNEHQAQNPEDLILEESFKVLSVEIKKRLSDLTLGLAQLSKQSEQISADMTHLAKYIAQEQERHKKLSEMRQTKKRLISSLDQEIKNYDSELKRIVRERESLKNILKELNITKEREAEKARRLKEEQLRAQSKTQAEREALQVRQIASSYHDVSTVKYHGSKTIPPLDRYRIEQKFGPYYDPVYKIKVFNESVVFNPKERDAKVYSVLDGKVVFAKETPMLKRVVIIEHKGSIHTIYAQLDKIAPTIKPGTIVKKGYTIGRVDSRLKFEVTQKEHHIDPLEFITVK